MTSPVKPSAGISNFQGNGAVTHGDTMFYAQVLGKRLFELLNHRAVIGKPAPIKMPSKRSMNFSRSPILGRPTCSGSEKAGGAWLMARSLTED